MPVYYDEISERKEFIKTQLKNSNYSLSDFATYIYEDNIDCMGAIVNDYDDIIDTVAEKYSNVDMSDILGEIYSVIEESEREFLDTWSSRYEKIDIKYIFGLGEKWVL